ncbi:MAG: hypothetical protein GDA37_11565 [Ekhidna sp.]|nr:hypothetical protein [Ekhidna sp.]
MSQEKWDLRGEKPRQKCRGCLYFGGSLLLPYHDPAHRLTYPGKVKNLLLRVTILFFEDGTPCDRLSTLPQISLTDADVF